MIPFLLSILIITCVHGQLTRYDDGEITPTASNASYGYEVSIFYYSGYICGGSIISSRYVITAAHCTDGDSPSDLTVKTCPSSTATNIVRIYQHPNYNPSTTDFDLSILYLDSDLEGTPIKLPADNQDIPIGAHALVSGCNFEPVVQQIVGSSQCFVVAGYKFCALSVEGNEGLCSGASGSPLVVEGELLGVFSWGYSCVQNLPNVYTNVASLRGFIRQVTGI